MFNKDQKDDRTQFRSVREAVEHNLKVQTIDPNLDSGFGGIDESGNAVTFSKLTNVEAGDANLTITSDNTGSVTCTLASELSLTGVTVESITASKIMVAPGRTAGDTTVLPDGAIFLKTTV